MIRSIGWSWPHITTAGLIMRKQVDWSLLRSGWTVPVDVHERVVDENDGVELQPRDKRHIVLLIDGHPFGAMLTCVRRPQGPPHILQVRYDRNHELRRVLSATFWTSRACLELERAKLRKKLGPDVKLYAEVPAHCAEFIEWRSTGVPFCYRVDLLPCRLRASGRIQHVLTGFGEPHVEAILAEASENRFAYWVAAIERITPEDSAEVARTLRYCRRYLSLAQYGLGQMYGHTCQLCTGHALSSVSSGTNTTHHIDPVTTSMDNRISNLVLVCPTHHAMLHAHDFVFDRAGLSFVSPEMGALKIAMDKHLGS